MDTFFVGALIALVIGILLLFLEYRTKWFANSKSGDTEAKKHPDPKSKKTKVKQANTKDSKKGIFETNASEVETIYLPVAEYVVPSLPQSVYRKNPSPDEIMAAYNNATPYQRKTVGQSYVGVYVDWDLTFHDLYEEGQHQFHVTMLNSEHSYPWVYCTVDIDAYPELKILQEGHPMSLTGQIEKVRGNEIFLKDCTLKIP